MATNVKEGGVGVWGEIPMPPQTQVNEREITQILNFIFGFTAE